MYMFFVFSSLGLFIGVFGYIYDVNCEYWWVWMMDKMMYVIIILSIDFYDTWEKLLVWV